MPKPTIIPNWHYQKPSKGGYRGLKNLLKYVSYRESPDHRPVELNERWTDCGLGKNWREVYKNAGKLAGPYVLAHHLVFAPAPELMALVPEALRHELVRELTERTIDTWHIACELNTPEFSYVLHDRDTDDDYGLQNLHTHIFVAGTVENSIGERESRRVERQQVCTDRGGLKREDNLHRIARNEFETLLDRTIGHEWRRLREIEPEIEHGIDAGHSVEIDL
ncbi:MAG: hypothetical protein ABI700_05530 [Chloroflexota bacterium]